MKKKAKLGVRSMKKGGGRQELELEAFNWKVGCRRQDLESKVCQVESLNLHWLRDAVGGSVVSVGGAPCPPPTPYKKSHLAAAYSHWITSKFSWDRWRLN